MEKSLNIIWEEVGRFRKLKPDQQKKELEDLSQKEIAIVKEIAVNSEAIKRTETDLKNAETRKKAIQEEYQGARQKRQNAVALGEDDKKFKVSISDLNVELDLLEDTCIGLTRRIENLTSEGDLLEQEKAEIQKTILQFKIAALIDPRNKKAEELAHYDKEIVLLADQLNEPFYEFRSDARTVFYSSWEGISALAKLYLGAEVDAPEVSGLTANSGIFLILKMFMKRFEKKERRLQRRAGKSKKKDYDIGIFSITRPAPRRDEYRASPYVLLPRNFRYSSGSNVPGYLLTG